MKMKKKKGFTDKWKKINKQKEGIKKEKGKLLELLYMSTEEFGVKEIELVLQDCDIEEVHVWKELEILEITLKNQETVDFEIMTGFINQEDDLAFIEEHQYKTIYAITVNELAFEEFKKVMANIVDRFKGELYSDSDDFMPKYEL